MIVALSLAASLLVAAPAVAIQPQAAPAQRPSLIPAREVVAEIRVHGNQIVPDAEVLKIAGLAAGVPFTEAILAEVTERLKASGRFESIDVVKRFASIEDASRVMIVIIVSE